MTIFVVIVENVSYQTNAIVTQDTLDLNGAAVNVS